jgi:hypothetical protein
MIKHGWGRWLFAAWLPATILTACGPTSNAPPVQPPVPGELIWPAPANPLDLTMSAGLQPETKETLTFHVHVHLDVFIDGNPVLVPAGIGINVTDPAVKHGEWNGGPTYGGIAGCSQPCISPLHTHYVSGVIHTESATSTPHELGQFFTEWGVTLSGSCVGRYCTPAIPFVLFVNGSRYSGSAADIPLTDRKEIAIVIGAPPDQIPSSFPSWALG